MSPSSLSAEVDGTKASCLLMSTLIAAARLHSLEHLLHNNHCPRHHACIQRSRACLGMSGALTPLSGDIHTRVSRLGAWCSVQRTFNMPRGMRGTGMYAQALVRGTQMSLASQAAVLHMQAGTLDMHTCDNALTCHINHTSTGLTRAMLTPVAPKHKRCGRL
jgi:hypothetical protein